MSGLEVVLPYIAGATAVNTVYGAVTGTPGGLLGEIFGADEPPPRAPAPAPAPAAAPSPTPVVIDEPPAAAAIPSVTPPPAAATLIAPPVVEAPTPAPTLSAAQTVARRATAISQRQRRGRTSTILTGDTLG